MFCPTASVYYTKSNFNNYISLLLKVAIILFYFILLELFTSYLILF